MRGVSPVISYVLLVGISVGVVALLYPWAQSMVFSLQSKMRSEAAQTSHRLGAVISISPPPALGPGPKVVIIHNPGSTTLSDVNAKVWDENGSLVPVDLNFAFSCTDPGSIAPGCFAFFTLDSNDLRGWSIFVYSSETSARYDYRVV